MSSTSVSTSRVKGFSMLEVLVASAILSVCLLPVLLLSQQGLTESGITQEELLCRQILIDMCERYKTAWPADLEKLQANPALIAEDEFLTPLRAATTDRQKQLAGRSWSQVADWRIERAITVDKNCRDLLAKSGEAEVAGLHRVTFTVSWNSRRGVRQEVSLSRLVHAH